MNQFELQQAQSFLDGADPWVIAQAKVDGSVVVTREVPAGTYSKKVKIPNVCLEFDVEYVNTYTMLRDCGARYQ